MHSEATVSHEALEEFTCRVLLSCGLPDSKARLVAESLVAANLRGVDSHGVHLLPYYVEQLRAGNFVAPAEGRVVSESGASLLYDGECGVGQWTSSICCQHAVRLARAHGLGMVVARHSSHMGALAFWGQRISETGMIGIVMTNASAIVPPWQGREGRFGTNPICVALPTTGKGAWLLDMATTTVAMGKIKRALANRQDTIPPGWAMDSDGAPTTETEQATLLNPLGGYKGSGLAMLVEVLCAVLSGGPMSTEVSGLYNLDRRSGTSHMFLALDVARFMPLQEFQQRMEHLVTVVKSSQPAKGYDEVLVAGEPEWRFEQERRQNGIPIDAGTWERFERVAEETHVPLPAR